MTLAETHTRAKKRRSYGRFIEDVDELVPTRVFTREREIPAPMQAPPREFRGRLPSERALIARMLGELCSLAPEIDASRPLTWTPGNVFLTPPGATDPLPPWACERGSAAKALVHAGSPRRRSILPLVALAMAPAIGLGLWRDQATRANVTADLAHAASTVTALVLETTLR